MTDIQVKYCNDVHVKVECNESIRHELSDYFTFTPPDAQFRMRHKKFWDGKIRLFNKKTKKIYRGLVDYIVLFAETNKYTIEIDPKLSAKLTHKKEDIEKYINETFKPTNAEGERLTYRESQVKSVYEAWNNKRVLLLSPTSSGKSLTIYTLARMFSQLKSMHGKKVLIIVPTTSLVEQICKDFADYSKDNGWDAEKYTHKIYSGHEKVTKKPIVVSTWQSIYEFPKEYFEQFGTVVVDEAHGAEADSITGIMEKLENCPNRIGLTGTVKDAKTHHLTLTGLFGKIVRVDHAHKMMERGEAAKLKINIVILKHSKEEAEKLHKRKLMYKEPRKKYQEEVDFLTSNEKRNLFIKNLALSMDKNTLVLFHLIEKHGDKLYDLIARDAAATRPVSFVHGGTDVQQRETVRQLLDKSENAIGVCSMGVFSTGINSPGLVNAIFASSTKSKIKVLQSIGRTLRITDTKSECFLWDIVDDLTYNGIENFTLKHAFERMDIYDREKFEYEIHRLEL